MSNKNIYIYIMIIRFMKRYFFIKGYFYLFNFKINVENSLNFCFFDRNC